MPTDTERLQAVFASARFTADAAKREVYGLVVPWDTPGNNWQGTWSFAPGSITWDTANVGKVKFLSEHNTRDLYALLGAAVEITSQADGLYARFRVSKTPQGDAFLAMAVDGILDGLSMGISLESATRIDLTDDGTYRVTGGAHLEEVSVVTTPGFADARIQSVTASAGERASAPSPQFMREITLTTTTGTENVQQPVTVNFDGAAIGEAIAAGFAAQAEASAAERTAFAAAMTELAEKLAAPQEVAGGAPGPIAQVTEQPVYSLRGGISQHSLVRDLWFSQNTTGADADEAAARFAKFNAQLADRTVQFTTGTTSNLAELMPTTNRQDLYLPNLDFDTPLWDAISQGSIADATPWRLPQYLSSSALSGPHVEGTNPTGGTLATTTQTVTPSSISGAFDLTREIAQSSNPAIDQIALAEMAREYSEDREALIAAMFTAVTTGIGATQTFTGTGAALIDAFKTQITAAKFRRGGNRISKIVTEQDAYQGLALAKDGNGRPLLPALGVTNADGSVSDGLDGLNLSGYPVTGSWALAAASYAFAAQSVWAWASPIQEFRFEEQSGPANIRLAHFSYFATHVLRPGDIIRVVYTAG